jgi:4-hydroxy-4-methyl-2-oxoglutarate aldolase
VLGFVTDGVVRDSDRIRELGFPVFCGGVALFGPQKERPGTLQAEIELEGVAVAPGDWIVADGDGVVVVPAGELDAALEAAEAIERREAQMIARARAGESTIAQLGLE